MGTYHFTRGEKTGGKDRSYEGDVDANADPGYVSDPWVDEEAYVPFSITTVLGWVGKGGCERAAQWAWAWGVVQVLGSRIVLASIFRCASSYQRKIASYTLTPDCTLLSCASTQGANARSGKMETRRPRTHWSACYQCGTDTR